MRIEVLGEGTISAQARTYAEYRLFAALSQLVDTDRVKRARLVLRRMKPCRTCDSVSCRVTVDIEGSKPFRIQVAGDHPYAAVNRAIERVSEHIQLEGCYAVDTHDPRKGSKDRNRPRARPSDRGGIRGDARPQRDAASGATLVGR